MSSQSLMSPYLMRKVGTRNKRRISRLQDPVSTSVHNFDSNNIMNDDDLSSRRLLDGDDQGDYYSNPSKEQQMQPFNATANVIRGGRPNNTGVVGTGRGRAKIERR